MTDDSTAEKALEDWAESPTLVNASALIESLRDQLAVARAANAEQVELLGQVNAIATEAQATIEKIAAARRENAFDGEWFYSTALVDAALDALSAPSSTGGETDA
jgi:hypothetical protein